MNTQVIREPISPEKIKLEIDDVFVFNPPLSFNHATSCQKIQDACKALAQVIADEVPEGKEQVIAINSLLSAALFARHGITRRQVVVVSCAAPGTISSAQRLDESTSPAPTSSPSSPSPDPSQKTST